MASYRYIATDATDKQHHGQIDARSEQNARALLRSQGLWVLNLTETAQPQYGRHKLDVSRLAFLVRQWASLLSASLTVEQSLDALIGQCEVKTEQDILAEVRGAVRSGESLASALAHFPRTFDDSFCALIAAGESAGKLPQLMVKLADQLETRRQLQQKIGLALLYPIIVAIVASGVIVALLIFVVPQVVEVFAGSRQTLPLPTRVLIMVSTGLRVAGPWLLLSLLLTVILASALLRHKAVRESLHPIWLRLPLLGRLLGQADAGRIAGALGVLTEAGVPLMNALDIAAATARLAPFRDALQRSARAVREGRQFSKALAAEVVFPIMLAKLAAVGESSGRLGEMLSQAGRQLDNQTAHRSAWLAGILEPLTILVMGAVVLAIVLAVLLPIVEMNQLLK